MFTDRVAVRHLSFLEAGKAEVVAAAGATAPSVTLASFVSTQELG